MTQLLPHSHEWIIAMAIHSDEPFHHLTAAERSDPCNATDPKANYRAAKSSTTAGIPPAFVRSGCRGAARECHNVFRETARVLRKD